MSWLSFYNELKGWQSVIGSTLGFGALIAGALFNAHLNRKRDDRLRNAEAITIALSLYGEILLLRGDVAAMAASLGSWYVDRGGYASLPEYYRELYPLRKPTLYNALAPKLGMLNPDLLMLVTNFYSNYEATLGHFPKIFDNKEQKITYGPEWVIAPAISAAEDVEEALREIERLGGIRTPAVTPSTGRAHEAIELADAMRSDQE